MGGLLVGEVILVAKTVSLLMEGMLTALVGVTEETLFEKLIDFLAGITDGCPKIKFLLYWGSLVGTLGCLFVSVSGVTIFGVNFRSLVEVLVGLDGELARIAAGTFCCWPIPLTLSFVASFSSLVLIDFVPSAISCCSYYSNSHR